MPIHEKSLIRPENLRTHDKLTIDGIDVSGHWSTFIEPRFNPRYWIYLVRMGLESELLRDKDIIWQCVSCHKCTYACPRDVVPESIMPAYPWFALQPADPGDIRYRMKVLRRLGLPYTDAEIEAAPAQLEGKTEMDAMVAYLQNLGTSIKTRR